jgi:hypothetical protein
VLEKGWNKIQCSKGSRREGGEGNGGGETAAILPLKMPYDVGGLGCREPNRLAGLTENSHPKTVRLRWWGVAVLREYTSELLKGEMRMCVIKDVRI